MKKILPLITALVTLGLVPAFGQAGHGPQFGGAMGKLFGDNQTFSAALEFDSPGPAGEPITLPGKLAFDNGKSRFEANMSEMKGAKMPPGVMEHMKTMGMDIMISISRPDLKLMYVVYPGLNAYAQVASQDGGTGPDDFKVEVTELGKETVDGHDCVKKKVVVSDKNDNKFESTVWNASDLKNFPIKIETTGGGHPATMRFKDVSFAKPDASSFEVPSSYTKYTDVQTLVQTEMMKKMGGGMGMPQPQPAPQH